jgi:hypothetical protein
MLSLICPISSQRVNENVVRVTALLIVLLAVLYALTRSPLIVLLLAVDFYIRAFTSLKYSPLSWVAVQVNRGLNLPVHLTDKAKKVFAARVGLLFAVAMLALFFVYPAGSVALGLVLATFALLECAFNICVGCLVYTYVVFPTLQPRVK